MDKIAVENVVVPKSFKRNKPSEKKMNAVREYFKKNGTVDKPIVLQGDLLIDGYVRYLVAQENSMEFIPCVQTSNLNAEDENYTPMYIVGRFESSGKEYTWRLPNKVKAEVGDSVLVDSRFAKKSRAVVTVVKVFSSNDKEMLRHKRVIKKLRIPQKVDDVI